MNILKELDHIFIQLEASHSRLAKKWGSEMALDIMQSYLTAYLAGARKRVQKGVK